MAKICQLHADLHYFLCMEPVDMRKQFRGLQGIISGKYNRYLTQDEAFIFIGKTRTTAKILHRESNGLTLYVHKLCSILLLKEAGFTGKVLNNEVLFGIEEACRRQEPVYIVI